MQYLSNKVVTQMLCINVQTLNKDGIIICETNNIYPIKENVYTISITDIKNCSLKYKNIAHLKAKKLLTLIFFRKQEE